MREKTSTRKGVWGEILVPLVAAGKDRGVRPGMMTSRPLSPPRGDNHANHRLGDDYIRNRNDSKSGIGNENSQEATQSQRQRAMSDGDIKRSRSGRVVGASSDSLRYDGTRCYDT